MGFYNQCNLRNRRTEIVASRLTLKEQRKVVR